jgi:hypothetical protein
MIAAKYVSRHRPDVVLQQNGEYKTARAGGSTGGKMAYMPFQHALSGSRKKFRIQRKHN